MKKIKNYLTYVMLLFILVSPIQAAKKTAFEKKVLRTMKDNPSLSCERIAALVAPGTVALRLGMTDKVRAESGLAPGLMTAYGICTKNKK